MLQDKHVLQLAMARLGPLARHRAGRACRAARRAFASGPWETRPDGLATFVRMVEGSGAPLERIEHVWFAGLVPADVALMARAHERGLLASRPVLASHIFHRGDPPRPSRRAAWAPRRLGDTLANVDWRPLRRDVCELLG